MPIKGLVEGLPMGSTGLAGGEDVRSPRPLEFTVGLASMAASCPDCSFIFHSYEPGPCKGFPWRGRGGCKNPSLANGKLERLQHPQKSPKNKLGGRGSCGIMPTTQVSSIQSLRICRAVHSHSPTCCVSVMLQYEIRVGKGSGACKDPRLQVAFFSEFQ